MKPTHEKKWLKKQGYVEQPCCANCIHFRNISNMIGLSCNLDPSEWIDDIEPVELWGKCDHWEDKKLKEKTQ